MKKARLDVISSAPHRTHIKKACHSKKRSIYLLNTASTHSEANENKHLLHAGSLSVFISFWITYCPFAGIDRIVLSTYLIVHLWSCSHWAAHSGITTCVCQIVSIMLIVIMLIVIMLIVIMLIVIMQFSRRRMCNVCRT